MSSISSHFYLPGHQHTFYRYFVFVFVWFIFFSRVPDQSLFAIFVLIPPHFSPLNVWSWCCVEADLTGKTSLVTEVKYEHIVKIFRYWETDCWYFRRQISRQSRKCLESCCQERRWPRRSGLLSSLKSRSFSIKIHPSNLVWWLFR